MPHPAIFKPDTAKLKNAITAILGRAIRTIKRFSTALHNKCNLVVYTDDKGRTCSQFLKKDAFSGYSFEFKGDACAVTNKETGDVYVVTYSNSCKWCPCKSYKFSDPLEKNCKHLRMVSELKGGLEQAIAQTEFDSYIEYQADSQCTHARAIAGLDSYYCPDCKKSIEQGSAVYNEILNRKPSRRKRPILIDLLEVPAGCRLERTDDWIALEYHVHAWGYQNIRGVRSLVQKNIGRIVQMSDGIYTYRLTSGIARTFETTRDAIAYLVQVVGMSFEEIAIAYQERMAFQKKVARL